ncbi:NACHT domain-containing protein [Pelodictyon luteolum]|uniref:Uncharacterized protein n=1 Tax=Chlorobium luteolum (strain DSM 273 / BCRC 81028 / 2530) TaxID=319225 RepID=Q3B1W6_CHLL3|nr:hypothetical protein [Pelodictyon luteolum]ABB24665.1 hypothetical protein Plut_1811 [Pelodictyon luteolum DSM 273]
MLVQRTAIPIAPDPEGQPNAEPVNLDALRSIPAWVLLGEPGAGKSSAFRMEADATEGILIPIARFISADPESGWKNRTLFLDGLDENRSTGTNQQAILYQIHRKLRQLGSPNFRISCRATDWYGQSDKEAIISASPDARLPLYVLEPLNEENILQILGDNFNRSDGKALIEKAKTYGIEALLRNPQTLQLIAEALDGKSWPANRKETYEFACGKLAQEGNKSHRDRHRQHRHETEQLLRAAGQILATLLFAGKQGVALDPSVENEHFPTIGKLQPKDMPSAEAALGSRLFVPAAGREERLEPTHRSVAEYLGARWIGKEIDRHGLPLKRVFNLMCGRDGKAVDGLRGLYGWLATETHTARTSMIRSDPLSVALYGDPRAMGTDDKKLLLQEIHAAFRDNPTILREPGNIETLWSLFDPDLRDTYLDGLEDPGRDDATQTYTIFLLKALRTSIARSGLGDALKSLAADGSRWERVRKLALEAWMDCGAATEDAIEILTDFTEGTITDPFNELAGILLHRLFPEKLGTLEALRHFHRSDERISGMYRFFWRYEFPRKVPEGDLPRVLDELSRNPRLQALDKTEWETHDMQATLVTRALETHGDDVSDDILFSWLRLGTDEFGQRPHNPEFHQSVAGWLEKRPQRYFALLQLCFERSRKEPSPAYALHACGQILRAAAEPRTLGLWHFLQISREQNDILAREHLQSAVRSLFRKGQEGLTLEMLFEWRGTDPVKQEWLRAFLSCPIPGARILAASSPERELRDPEKIKRERSSQLAAKLDEIANGTAPMGLLATLASIWNGRFSDIAGSSPEERFRSYCTNDEEVVRAAESGMKSCITRNDLPTPAEIIKHSARQETFSIGEACLLGMQLLWDEEPKAVDLLPDETLESMICFRLVNGAGETPGWFAHLAASKPRLVAGILTRLVGAQLKARKMHIDGIHELGNDPLWKKVAAIAAPTLLENFPTRCRAPHLAHLGTFLKSALKYAPTDLPAIIARKLALKSLEPGQKIYYLLAGMLLEPQRYELPLWDFAGETWQRVRHIASFTSRGFSELQVDLQLSPETLSKLIELQAPFASPEWPLGGGTITESMELGDQVKSLISELAARGTEESLHEIDRLLALAALQKFRTHLQMSRHKATAAIRESVRTIPPLADVAAVLENGAPADPEDLLAIVLDQLGHVAADIRQSNSDIYRQFWTEAANNNRHKSEQSCRDALLGILRQRLQPRGIASEPEVDHAGDKRAAIRISFKNRIAIPVEIKGDWHRELWTAPTSQLPRYTAPAMTGGRAIYLVLWTGGREQPPPRDGGKKPRSPRELQERLEAFTAGRSEERTEVFVLDVSWPG